jgi:hypothetical protein
MDPALSIMADVRAYFQGVYIEFLRSSHLTIHMLM